MALDSNDNVVFTVSTRTMDFDHYLATVLGYPDSAHGPKLRIRDVDDTAADLHETDSTL